MQKYFVNFTNHPSIKWDEKQKMAALGYGEIVDISFPMVEPLGDESYIDSLAETCLQQILLLRSQAVLCQGEFCLAFRVISRLREKGILVLAACSERKVREDAQKKEVIFQFQQFRRY